MRKEKNNNVTIITLNGYFNYGNRLQLFALTKTLKTIKVGCSVTEYWPLLLKPSIKEILQQNTLVLGDCIKEKKIKRFSNSFIKRVRSLKGNRICIIGSDQVWNPDYYLNNPYLLNVPSDGIKIAYAASIGKDTLSPKELSDFSKSLRDYKAISVREKTAMHLLQPLTRTKVETVLDPTLLLEKKEYEQIEKKPKDVKEGEKYILCYILGGREQMNAVSGFAKKNRCKIILFSDKKESNYGVEEFLYLINHAQLICTDSFHACVFSFIFERPFVVFKRSGEANYMYTRLQNLIDTFQLKNCEFHGREIIEENLKVNYDNAKKILEKERGKSLNFLRKALDIQNEE